MSKAVRISGVSRYIVILISHILAHLALVVVLHVQWEEELSLNSFEVALLKSTLVSSCTLPCTGVEHNHSL